MGFVLHRSLIDIRLGCLIIFMIIVGLGTRGGYDIQRQHHIRHGVCARRGCLVICRESHISSLLSAKRNTKNLSTEPPERDSMVGENPKVFFWLANN